MQKKNQSAVYDKNLNVVLPFIDGSVSFDDNYINVLMNDHSLRKYDYYGNLVSDFCVNYVEVLLYDTEELLELEARLQDSRDEYDNVGFQNKKATARLRSYTAADEYKGLMTADGHRVTMPLYKNIHAISFDTYLCTIVDEEKVIVNGKGEIVE